MGDLVTVCTATPSAAWSADRLLDALQSRGWGELDGRPNQGLRTVLNALVSLLPYQSAEGRLTRAQVADASGLSVKWTSKCLARLEALGVIVWRRGWLDHGQQRAGHIRIQKSRLAELVRAVRGYLDDRKARRAVETRQRLAKLRTTTVPPWKRRHPLSSRGELSSPLPIQGSTRRSTGAFAQPSQTLPGLGEIMPGCTVCGRSEDQCHQLNAKVPDRHRHTYQPGRSSRATLVTPAHELRRPAETPHRPWRDRATELLRPPHPTIEGLE